MIRPRAAQRLLKATRERFRLPSAVPPAAAPVDVPELTYSIVGAGSAARTHLRDITAKPGVRLVGIADPAEHHLWQVGAELEHLARFSDAAELFARLKPQLVSICTPPKFHHAIALAALACGAHVVCEKPLALTLDEALAMERARAAAGRIGAVNFSCRNIPAFRLARQLIADGELGAIRRVSASYLQSYLGVPEARWSWRDDIAVAGFGALGDLGAHVIDAVRFILQTEFLEVDAALQTLLPTRLAGDGSVRAVTTDSNAVFLGTLRDGVFAMVEASQVAGGYKNFFRLEISGEYGSLVVNREEPDVIQLLPESRRGTTTRVVTRRITAGDVRATDPSSPAGIVDAIRGRDGGRDVGIPTFADGIAVQRVLSALLVSAERRGWVTIES